MFAEDTCEKAYRGNCEKQQLSKGAQPTSEALFHIDMKDIYLMKRRRSIFKDKIQIAAL